MSIFKVESSVSALAWSGKAVALLGKVSLLNYAALDSKRILTIIVISTLLLTFSLGTKLSI